MTKVTKNPETIALHGGDYRSDPATTAVAVPIYRTTSYQFNNTEHAANLFALKEFGNIYTRIMNPTNDVLEKRLAALEGGLACVTVGSGQAASTFALINVCQSGDNFISSTDLYGGTVNLFTHTLKKLGIEVIAQAKSLNIQDAQVGVRIKEEDDITDLTQFLEECDFAMFEIDSKRIHDEKLVLRSKEKNCEPIYLAKMPTLMSGQVQSRDENLEIGHTLEDGFDMVALYQETARGPYPARSVKCLDEIAVESEKLRVNPFGDFMSKIFSIFKKK